MGGSFAAKVLSERAIYSPGDHGRTRSEKACSSIPTSTALTNRSRDSHLRELRRRIHAAPRFVPPPAAVSITAKQTVDRGRDYDIRSLLSKNFSWRMDLRQICFLRKKWEGIF